MIADLIDFRCFAGSFLVTFSVRIIALGSYPLIFNTLLSSSLAYELFSFSRDHKGYTNGLDPRSPAD